MKAPLHKRKTQQRKRKIAQDRIANNSLKKER
jgi:hypothetical protein